MKFLTAFLLLSWSIFCWGQTSEADRFLSRLVAGNEPPGGLLASRVAVLYAADYTQPELEKIQKAFQQIGIDAISYVESDRALAGRDLMNAYGNYFVNRDIRFLLFLKKEEEGFQFNFVPFNAKSSWTNAGESCWQARGNDLTSTLQTVFRSLIAAQKRQSFLINEFPERNGPSSVIGQREEDFCRSLRGAKIAIPRFGDPAADAELEKLLKEWFHIKYELVDADASEKYLLDKDFVMTLRFVHARGSLAKEILGYDMSKSESALATVHYTNGNLQLKTIPSNEEVFKFYFKNIEDNIFYLGRKWDADITWQDALRNCLDGYRAAGKLD